MEISLDPSKNLTVGGDCPKGGNNQTLSLSWADISPTDNKTTLEKSLTFSFMENKTTGNYGINQIMGAYDVIFRGKKVSAKLSWNYTDQPLFPTNVNNSYSCSSSDPVSLEVEWDSHPNCSASTTTKSTTTTTTKKTTTTTTKSTTTTTKSTTTTTTKSTTTTTKSSSTPSTTTKRTTTTRKTTTTTPKTTIKTTPKPTPTTPKNTTKTTPKPTPTTPKSTIKTTPKPPPTTPKSTPTTP